MTVPLFIVVLLMLTGGFHPRILIGPEAQQGSDTADAIKLLVIGDINNLNTAAYRVADNSVANVLQFCILLAANRAHGCDVDVHVTTVETLDSGSQKIRSQQ